VPGHEDEGVRGALLDDHLQHALHEVEHACGLQVVLRILCTCLLRLFPGLLAVDWRGAAVVRFDLDLGCHLGRIVHLHLVLLGLAVHGPEHDVARADLLHDLELEHILRVHLREAEGPARIEGGLAPHGARADGDDGLLRDALRGDEVDLHRCLR